jgi:S-adenosylmethionine decarboxylase
VAIAPAVAVTAAEAAINKPLPLNIRPNGLHILADLWSTKTDLLCNTERIAQVLLRAASAANAQVLQQHMHSFGEHKGVTGVVMLAESHISIHSWPEHQLAAIDIFICGQANSNAALTVIELAFEPYRTQIHRVERGLVKTEIA